MALVTVIRGRQDEEGHSPPGQEDTGERVSPLTTEAFKLHGLVVGIQRNRDEEEAHASE